jgi:6-phosphogluconolactonase
VKIEVYDDDQAVSQKAALVIADDVRNAVAARGRFVMALSGGRTPWMMLRGLAEVTLPWDKIHIFQVDERIAPDGDKDRNLTHLRDALSSQTALPPDHIHAMPVEAPDLSHAARDYAQTLEGLAGAPPVLDLIHLGLGADGHTASLVPGDQALDVNDADVATTRPYQGHNRMTLTFPVINRARRILWLVTGGEKANALARLNDGDRSIPAGRVRRDEALILADAAAAKQLGAAQ